MLPAMNAWLKQGAENIMLITVVIPTCDRPIEYLRKSIWSAMDQSNQPHEILIVDNGEKPVSAQNLPLGVVLHRAKPLIGPSKARNIGAKLATGSHLAFLDDDDWWDKDFLREAADVLKKGPYRCVYGRLVQWRNGEFFEKKNLTAESLVIDVLLRTNPGASGQNILIEKRLFE